MTGGAGADRPAEIRGMDGTVLRGTMRAVRNPVAGALLVHGLTGDREENGLYTELADRLAHIRVQSLRYDMRGHGQTGGRYEEVTMSGTIADIGAAYSHAAGGTPPGTGVFVVGSSFGGAMSACWAAGTAMQGEPEARSPRSIGLLARPAPLAGIVLLCPQFDVRSRFLTGKPHYWGPHGILRAARDLLARRGWLEHDGGFRVGRAMFDELSVVRPQDRIAGVDVPVLTMHGDMDSVAPYDVSHDCTARAPDSEFATIVGADHGFVHPSDGTGNGEHEDTRRFRDAALSRVVAWIAARA